MKPLSPRYTSMKFGWLLALATIAIGTYFLIAGAGVPGQVTPTYKGPDTWTYYGFRPLDRPPLYPILLNGTEIFFGNLHTWVVGIIQIIIWGLSTVAMWHIAVPRNGRWGIVVVVIYALLPPFVMWSVARFVEAVAIPLMVFCALFLSEWIKQNKNLFIYLFAFSLILLLLTRPAFVYVFIATVMTAIPLIANQAKRQQGTRLLIVGVLAIIFTGVYSTYVYWQSGVFVPSLISVNNKYYMAREAHVLDPKLNPSPVQRKMIAERFPDMKVGSTNEKELAIWREIDFYGDDQNGLIHQTLPIWQIHKVKNQLMPYQCLNEMINRSISAHKYLYYKYTIVNVYKSFLSQPIISGGHDFPSRLFAPPLQHQFGQLQVKLGLTLATATVFLLCVLISLLCKPRKLIARIFLLWMVLCCLGNLATVALGAPIDHSRLFVESVPLFFLIVAAVGHSFSRRIYKQYCKN